MSTSPVINQDPTNDRPVANTTVDPTKKPEPTSDELKSQLAESRRDTERATERQRELQAQLKIERSEKTKLLDTVTTKSGAGDNGRPPEKPKVEVDVVKQAMAEFGDVQTAILDEDGGKARLEKLIRAANSRGLSRTDIEELIRNVAQEVATQTSRAEITSILQTAEIAGNLPLDDPLFKTAYDTELTTIFNDPELAGLTQARKTKMAGDAAIAKLAIEGTLKTAEERNRQRRIAAQEGPEGHSIGGKKDQTLSPTQEKLAEIFGFTTEEAIAACNVEQSVYPTT